MQTFLPWPDFYESAATLEWHHLGNQRNETFVVLTSIFTGRGWPHHPVTNMWRGYEAALLLYQEAICWEWTQRRGYKDTVLDKTYRLFDEHMCYHELYFPPWLGWDEFHLTHQSNLVRKKPEYYRPQFPDVERDIPYIYPGA